MKRLKYLFPITLLVLGLLSCGFQQNTPETVMLASNIALKDTGKIGTIVKTVAEWKKLLTPEQFRVLRLKGTEPAFSGAYWDNKMKGMYHCAACQLPLFDSGTKFRSGTGWPSFFKPVLNNHITEHIDNTYGMRRVEVTCGRCDGHLGHVFEDGPAPTGMRYCINSEALVFERTAK
jgi:peptide-methionine (R)-S-oxide reductase